MQQPGDPATMEEASMENRHEEELARELIKRGLTRRQVIAIGLKLGLGTTSLGALLAACGGSAQPATAPTTAPAGGALPDLFYIHFSWAQDLIKNTTMIALDDYVAKEKEFNLDDFIKQSLTSYKRDGKLWVIPYDEGPGILYYNKDIFDKAGVKY